jgi:hypothetical protein
MSANEDHEESELVVKIRRIGTCIHIGFENIVGGFFVFEGLLVVLSMTLIVTVFITHPEVLAAMTLKNWAFGISFMVFTYLIGVIFYNAGIEHFPKLHRYKMPSPNVLKHISLYIHDHMIVVKPYRSP